MKKTTALLLALVLCVTLLAGCGAKKIPMETVTVSEKDYGVLSLSFPEGSNITVEYPEPNKRMEVISENTLQVQRAHLTGEGFQILMGYRYLGNDKHKTYQAAYEDYKKRTNSDDFRDIQYGNATGYVHEDFGCSILVFPSPNEKVVRMIAVFTDETRENWTKSHPNELLELPEVDAILKTLVLADAEETK